MLKFNIGVTVNQIPSNSISPYTHHVESAPDESSTLRLVTNVRHQAQNTYLELFYQALTEHGVVHVGQWEAQPRWLAEHADSIDAVHFHWPETDWRGKHWFVRRLAFYPRLRALRRRLESWDQRRQVARWCRQVAEIKQRGLLVVWTVHNLEPHETPRPTDFEAYRYLAESADLVICHAETTRLQFLERYPTSADVVVMPHGNYADTFPAARPPETVREELGLRSDLPVVACLGQIRPYKGVDLLCSAVARLEGQVQLLVGGMHTKVERDWLRAQVQAVPGSVLVDRALSQQEYADFAAAADIIALPYRRVTGSGALLAALTLGRGVVAANLPYFQEILAENPSAGVLFEPENVAALAEAIQDYLQIPAPQRETAALELAQQFDWFKVTQPVATRLLTLHRSRLAE